MSKYNKKNRIDGSILLYRAQLEELKKKLENQDLSSRDLESVSQELNTLKDAVLGSEYQAIYQSLCGKANRLNINKRIGTIVEKTDSLLQGKYSSQKELATTVDALKKEIHEMWRDHGLSNKNLCHIKMAEKKLAHLFHPQKDNNMSHDRVNSIQTQAPLPPNWDLLELPLNICKIAQFLYEHKDEKGLTMLDQLMDERIKLRLKHHCLATKATLPEKDTTLDPLNRLHLIQALIGLAEEMAQGEANVYYLSPSQVQIMFEEASSFH